MRRAGAFPVRTTAIVIVSVIAGIVLTIVFAIYVLNMTIVG